MAEFKGPMTKDDCREVMRVWNLRFKETSRIDENDPFFDNFCTYALKLSYGIKDKINSAMQLIVANQSAFPSTADLHKAFDRLAQTKKPIDYIAQGTPDARTILGCEACDYRGYQMAETPAGYSTIYRCEACDGRGLTMHVATREFVEKKGYRAKRKRA